MEERPTVQTRNLRLAVMILILIVIGAVARMAQAQGEKGEAKIAEEARFQYTLGYYTHEPFIDGKYRKIDVRVDRPGLEIVAKPGYYPSAKDSN